MAASPRISTDIPTADHGPTIAGQGPCIAAKAATYVRIGSFASARCALDVRATSALLRKRSTSCDTASDRGLVFRRRTPIRGRRCCACEAARACPIPTSYGYWMPACAGMTAEVSLDHLVGQREQRWRNLESERPGGPEIEHEFEFGGLHDRKIGRLLTFENSSSIVAGLAVSIGDTRSVTAQR